MNLDLVLLVVREKSKNETVATFYDVCGVLGSKNDQFSLLRPELYSFAEMDVGVLLPAAPVVIYGPRADLSGRRPGDVWETSWETAGRRMGDARVGNRENIAFFFSRFWYLVTNLLLFGFR